MKVRHKHTPKAHMLEQSQWEQEWGGSDVILAGRGI